MTNVEFIATYIFNNPGARYTQIMESLRCWRGIPEYNAVWASPGKRRRSSWGTQYFNRYATASNRYIDTHWTYVVPGNPHSGYILTFKGMQHVCDVITSHRGDK